MHLAGWNFTIREGHQSQNMMNVMDVKIPDFFEAQKVALQQCTPSSEIIYSRPLAEEELGSSMAVGSLRKWIALQETAPNEEKQTLPDLWPNVEMVNFAPK